MIKIVDTSQGKSRNDVSNFFIFGISIILNGSLFCVIIEKNERA